MSMCYTTTNENVRRRARFYITKISILTATKLTVQNAIFNNNSILK